MLISLIVATDQAGAIGLEGRLPWHLPEDLRYFKSKTLNHCVVMGRKTCLSIGRPLPGRTNLLLSRSEEPVAGFVRVATPESAVAFAQESGETELFVIGGAQVYEAFLPHADRIYLTEIAGRYHADTFFALPQGWQIERGAMQTSAMGIGYAFHVYHRIGG